MFVYMAPMEGITGYIYRNTFAKYFGGVDRYFTPFIAPAQGRPLRTRELKDILPENNKNLPVIPQILTNNVEGFVKTAKFLLEYGYEEVNINLGCPSGTVVAKYKGSGLLYDINRLDEFLYGVFEANLMKVSIKTRIGRDFPEEFSDVLGVYEKYPISELIIHPRVQKDFYKNKPNLEAFELALGKEDGKICYNGDIFTLEDFNVFSQRFPNINKIMLGRGLIGNPFLPEEIKGNINLEKTKEKRFKAFHHELFEKYLSSDLGTKNTLFKMKELWQYQSELFHGQENARQIKKIKKSTDILEYKEAVNNLHLE